MNAVIYCRVSTEEQIKNLSLSTQRKACVEYCEGQGFEVSRVFIEEGESAKTVNRTQFQKLLAYCRENRGLVQYVVVYNLQRFARNTHDHLAVRALLQGFGVSLRSATEQIDETSTGRFVESVLAAVNQLDNDIRADRTVAGMKAAGFRLRKRKQMVAHTVANWNRIASWLKEVNLIRETLCPKVA